MTLLGDAAHLMPPSGEGADLAMYDGSELGNAIAAHPDDIEVALARCEEAMFARSAAEAADSAELLTICFGDNAPYSIVEFFTSPASPRKTGLGWTGPLGGAGTRAGNRIRQGLAGHGGGYSKTWCLW